MTDFSLFTLSTVTLPSLLFCNKSSVNQVEKRCVLGLCFLPTAKKGVEFSKSYPRLCNSTAYLGGLENEGSEQADAFYDS